LPARVSVVTNIDAEHMDHYDSFEDVRKAYRSFVNAIPFYGYAVLCLDHPEVQALIPHITDRKIITYGFSPQADVQASNIRHSAAGVTYDIRFAAWLDAKGQERVIEGAFMPMLGDHNVQNALVALAIADQMDVSEGVMRQALQEFTGVKRRFTKTGEVDGVTIIDDYAHHPVEINTVLKTARAVTKDTGGRVIAVMQPHRYTRLRDLFDDFCTAFNNADTVILAPVYSAGEKLIEGATHQALADAMKAYGHRDVLTVNDYQELPVLLNRLVDNSDYVICMGAGDITRWSYELPQSMATLKQNHAAE